MTEIVFKYNPIQVRADIIIDGDEIAKTSNLYRYRNTPLEDWVDVLIPELVDYSNDDNIKIEICSLQKYIDEINKAIRVYEKKNRHIDIEVVENPSTGYKGRLNKLNQMLAEVDIENASEIADSYPLDVIIVSMAEEDEYTEVLENIFPNLNAVADKAILIANHECEEDGFEYTPYEINDFEDRYIDTRVFIFPSLNECSNKYWRLFREKVNGDGDYIIISVMNNKPKKNDELLDYLAEQLEKKGKINKSRFVFISDDPEDNLAYIQDEYGVKPNMMLEYNNADEAIECVGNYIQNVCYVRKLNKQCSFLRKYLENIQEDISRDAEIKKSCAEVKDVIAAYKKTTDFLVSHYESLVLTEYGSPSSKDATAQFIDVLTENIKEFVVDEYKKTYDKLRNGSYYRLRLTDYTEESMDQFKNGARENDVMILTEMALNAFLVTYLSEHFSLTARKDNFGDNNIVLQDEYSIISLINDKAEKLCKLSKNNIKRLSQIEKKPEYRDKMGFFAWVTENIVYSDIESARFIRYSCGDFNNDYSEVLKKIKRRIKTVEPNIEQIFKYIFNQLGFDRNSDILKKKISTVTSLAEESNKRVNAKYDELLKSMEISGEDKNKIEGIGNLITELDEIISL